MAHSATPAQAPTAPSLRADLIFTGTPAGVGNRRNPPRLLQPGETLVSRVDGIGEIRQTFGSQNERCAASRSSASPSPASESSHDRAEFRNTSSAPAGRSRRNVSA